MSEGLAEASNRWADPARSSQQLGSTPDPLAASGPAPRRERLHPASPAKVTVEDLAKQWPTAAWQRFRLLEGHKGPLVADFLTLRAVMPLDRLPGPEVWVVTRRLHHVPTALALIAYQQRHNYAAYCSHRKRLLAQLQGLRWYNSDRLKESMRCRRQFDDDRVAGPDLAVRQDDGHDAGLVDESTVFISPQHCGHQLWLEAVQLDTGGTQTRHFNDCRLAQTTVTAFTPLLSNDLVYLVSQNPGGYNPDRTDTLEALNLANGKLEWRWSWPEHWTPENAPTIVGGIVYLSESTLPTNDTYSPALLSEYQGFVVALRASDGQQL